MNAEFEKRRELRDRIFDLCWNQGKIHTRDGVSIPLREKMWIQTEREGYEFAADRIVCNKLALGLRHIEIYGTYGIHCSAYLLNSAQLKELARLIPFV